MAVRVKFRECFYSCAGFCFGGRVMIAVGVVLVGSMSRPAQGENHGLRSRLASPYVPMDSWVYAAFDRLWALGYAPSAFANLRPWTRMECARIIVAAGEDLDADTPDA